MAHYCDSAPGDPLHAFYHDHEYGFPVTDDAVLFERFALEINQAGLSWGLMLKKRAGFRVAFKGFEPAVVADFGTADRDRLLADAGIIRNRLKIDAVIENARRITILQAEHGSFCAWLAAQYPRNKEDWIKSYIFWEIDLLSDIGYGLDLTECAVTSEKENLKFVSPSSGRAVTIEGAGSYKDKLFKLPNFLINRSSEYNNEDLENALNLTEHFFRKRFYEPNNLNFPKSRNHLKISIIK